MALELGAAADFGMSSLPRWTARNVAIMRARQPMSRAGILSLVAYTVRVAAKVVSGKSDAVLHASVTALEIELELYRSDHQEKSANGGGVAIAPILQKVRM